MEDDAGMGVAVAFVTNGPPSLVFFVVEGEPSWQYSPGRQRKKNAMVEVEGEAAEVVHGKEGILRRPVDA